MATTNEALPETGDRSGPPLLGIPPTLRSRVEAAGWLLMGVMAAVAGTWPLARHLGSRVPQGTGDPLSQAWTIAWGGHALRHQPFALFDANVNFPARPSLAFADCLLGYAPAALIGTGPSAALLRYNLLFVASYALLFCAAALLARELGCTRWAAAVAGAACAFSPTRLDQNNHLNVLSTGGIVLTVFLLLSGYRRRRVWQVLAGWLAAAWQISLGFAMGIWFCYLLAALAAISAALWLRRGRQPLPRGLVLATVLGVAFFLAVVAALVAPYLTVVRMNPNALRSPEEIAFFSPPPRGLLVVPMESRFWGERAAALRNSLNWVNEQCVFPGVLIVSLAVLGLRWQGVRRGLRLGLGIAVLFLVVLSLGFRLEDGLFYRPLYHHLPGWNGIRTPGRLAGFWSVALGLLAAMGTDRVREAVRRRTSELWGSALVLTLAVAVGVEGSVALGLAPVRPEPSAVRSLTGPIAFFPSSFANDPYYMYWSTDGFPKIANGSGSYDPPELGTLRGLTGFPDPTSVTALRAQGIRNVVLDRVALPGTQWAGAAERSVDGLGITRRDQGEVVVYDLTPAGG